MKKAMLVAVSLMTRVIVDDKATYDEIVQATKSRFHDIVENDLGENIEWIEPDYECPYDPDYESDL
jgi:hypothetical protein